MYVYVCVCMRVCACDVQRWVHICVQVHEHMLMCEWRLEDRTGCCPLGIVHLVLFVCLFVETGFLTGLNSLIGLGGWVPGSGCPCCDSAAL